MCVVHDGGVGEVVVCTVGWRLGVLFFWLGGVRSVRLKQREAQKAIFFWKPVQSIWPFGTRLGASSDKGNYSLIRSCPAYM